MVKPEGISQPSEAAESSAEAADTTTTTTTNTNATTASGSVKPTAAPKPAPNPLKSKGYAYLFKYVLVGDSGVGKTALLQRFSRDVFVETHNYTIGVDFDVKTIDLPNGDEVKLQMWDTAGQERFRTITNSYYRGCHGIAVVYNINDEESFRNVLQWVNEARRYCNEDTVCVVIGTQKDKAENEDAAYGRDKMRELLQEHQMMRSEEFSPDEEVGVFQVHEVSAKTGEGVVEAFQYMTDTLVARKLNERNPLRAGRRKNKGPFSGHDTIELGMSGNKPKSRCC